MTGPTLYGADYSVYVRIARMALEEKGSSCELVPVDIFAEGGPPREHFARHPFGRIPAFEHDGFRLYETGAITRYVDEAFEGPALQPGDARQRARMNQIAGIADNYVYPHMVWGLYVELVSKAKDGQEADAARVAAGWKNAETCLAAIPALADEGAWLCASRITLADLYLAPMIDYFLKVPGAADLLARRPRLAQWWEAISARPSFIRTRPSG